MLKNYLSDLRFAQAILNERLNRLTQPYSPLASKLRSALAKLDELTAAEEAQAESEPQPKQHVELWVEGRGKRGVPETFRELVEDAEAIQKMLDELAEALESVQTNCSLGTYTTTEKEV